jgi:hypothetical protein
MQKVFSVVEQLYFRIDTDDLQNPLKPSGNYVYHRLLQSVTLHFVFMNLVRFLL